LRDIFVHYRQTTIGIVWVVLRSFLNVAIFTLIFGRFAGFPSEGVSYFMIVFSGMLIWQFFADLFIEGSNSLLNH
jgi:lipopolysaccharide transport system permease protein